MSDLVYRLTSVKKKYRHRCVLDVAEMEVRKGETLAIVGPNGAGKSTLLRLLNFLEPASEGEIEFEGRRQSFPVPLEIRRRLTMVFQRPLMFKLDVRRNVSLGLRMRGMANSTLVEDALKQLDLEKLANQPAQRVSGGEIQRVALARALVLEPEVLLLDEPTANLDPHNISLIEDIIKAIKVTKRTTMVLVTHNIFQARRLADRTGLLLAGSMIEMADTDAFFGRPRDPRVAAFVRGEMVY